MSSNPIQAFVSSTYQDIKDHRAHVIRALRKSGIFVDPMEDWTAESDEPRVFSSDRVKHCDFCVLLVAFRRGFIPENEVRSITQLEYQAAIDEGMDVLVYLLDNTASWPYQYDERGNDPEILSWRDYLEKRHGRELFGPDPRSIDVSPAITRWVVKHTHPVVGNLTGLAGELADHETVLRKRRVEVTSYLERVRDLIQRAHDELEQGRIPHGVCQQIFDTGDLLVRAIGADVPAEDLARLQNLLKAAYQVEILHEALRTDSDRRINLAALERTRGSFAALVESINVFPLAR
jgi:hypothetical protein